MLNLVLMPLNSIISMIEMILKDFIAIYEFIIEIMKMIPRILEIFFYITDPRKLINDLFFGVIKGVYMILDAILDTLFGSLRRQFGNKSDKGSNVSGGSGLNQKKNVFHLH